MDGTGHDGTGCRRQLDGWPVNFKKSKWWKNLPVNSKIWQHITGLVDRSMGQLHQLSKVVDTSTSHRSAKGRSWRTIGPRWSTSRSKPNGNQSKVAERPTRPNDQLVWRVKDKGQLVSEGVEAKLRSVFLNVPVGYSMRHVQRWCGQVDTLFWPSKRLVEVIYRPVWYPYTWYLCRVV